ncbi:Leucine-rich repeat-containing protein 40 [Hondaea fermentalgiana]|uniref:Leucine-rich repeat-containing protein 40 n=1 Tax=Hondaea fermentalgiana TaxID=2315210 RepID=A0A2R5GI56_9STRA|nr:Leucine-rich repeat-containing protein 40 [Hondaea fermentalgiana]|eukprot:GBG27971.1 Leucine-rich repeat-containing protein 40 [Hondaea fermentalgiana]
MQYHLTCADVDNFVQAEPETHANVSFTDWVDRLGSYKAASRQLRANEEARVEHREWLARKTEYDLFMDREAARERERRWTRGPAQLPRTVAEAARMQRLKKLERLELRMSDRHDVDILVRQAPFTERLDLQGKLHDNNIELFESLIEDERVLRVTEARFARNGLRSIPNGLHLHFRQLRVLDLSQNRLEKLPSDIALLRSLQELNIQYNKLEEIPTTVYELPALQVLVAGGNTFLGLHHRIAQASELCSISLDNNNIVTLPLALSELAKCERLNLNHNGLETLALFPPAAYSCMTAKELQEDMKHWKRVELPAKGESGYIHELTGEGRRTLVPLHDQLSLDTDPDLADFDVDAEQLVADFIAGVNATPKEKSIKPMASAAETNVTRLDLSKLNDKTRAGKLRVKQRVALARAGKLEWRYWINDKTGATEFGNIVTREVVRQGIPPALDRWNTLHGLRELLVNCNHLTELPASLSTLPRLERLEASQNRIVFVPEELSNLACLRVLALRENRIEKLPDELGKLEALERLELSGNRIVCLPGSVRFCRALRVLDLSSNCLEEVCADLGALTELEVLGLAGNPTLQRPKPETVRRGLAAVLWDCRNREKLRALGPPPPQARRENVGVAGEHVVVEGMYHKTVAQAIERARQTGILKMHFFGLRALPDQVFSLRRLRELRIAGHKSITVIPKHVMRLRSLEVLSFTANALREIPHSLAFWSELKELKEVDLCDNEIESLPAALSVLPKLKLLSLSGNRITHLAGNCFTGPIADSLERLHVNSNRLEELPPEINSLWRLRVLQLTYNELKELPFDLSGLKGLERLHLSRNCLHKLPDSLGQLARLRVLQLACNTIEHLQPALFAGPLCHVLETLHVQSNALRELPPALCELRALREIVMDGNPLESPPVSFRGNAWTAPQVLEYCEERQRRRTLLIDLLQAAMSKNNHFALDDALLMPRCKGAIVDKHSYLRAGDDLVVNDLVDRFMNCAFYDHEISAFDTIERLSDLFELRRNAKLRIVLDDLLKLVEIGKEYGLISPVDFTSELRIGFGRGNETVRTYAVRLSALYREIAEDYEDSDAENEAADDDDEVNSLSSLESYGNENKSTDGEDSDDDDDDNLSEAERAPNLIEAVGLLRREHQFVFEHSRELVDLALTTYRGPYGQIAWMRAPVSFDSDGGRLEFPEYIEIVGSDEKTSALPSTKEVHADVVVFSQLFYTLEEAARREREETEIAKVVKCATRTFEAWCELPEGRERLSSVAVDRIGRVAEVLENLKNDYEDARMALDVAREHLQEINRRVDMFENGEPEYLHHIKSRRKGDKLIREAEAEVEECTGPLERLEKLLNRAKGRKKLRLKQVIIATREEVMVIVDERAKVLQTHSYRMRALTEDLRRPWDGDNGQDFEIWKLARKRAMADQGIENVADFLSDEDTEELPPNDLVQVMGDGFAYDAYIDMLDQLGDDSFPADMESDGAASDAKDINQENS